MTDMIGFYTQLSTKDGKGYLGALLVTDDFGKPEEFRVTFPVRPTRVQRQLYGQALLPHIGFSLCGVPLYDALSNKNHLDLLLVSDRHLLLISAHAKCPVVHIEPAGKRLEVATDPTTQRDVLKSASSGFQPLTPTYPRGYTNEQKQDAIRLMEKFSKNIDLLEPFTRIQKAIAALADEDERFR